MITTILVIIIVMGLGLLFLWPIPFRDPSHGGVSYFLGNIGGGARCDCRLFEDAKD
jgi:hypothetical protein